VHFAARTLEDEVVFFDPESRTLLCADAVFNLASHPDRLTRAAAWALGNHQPGATWLERLLIRDRRAARTQIDHMLAWAPERILLAHGAPVETDATAVLREAYAWL
jgi:glyoxylase-like metal-dependent hydrolase (beta-lactamase superfamily II)